MTGATPVNENEIARQNNYASDIPSSASFSSVVTNPDVSTSISIPLYNQDGSFASQFALNVNAGQTAVVGATTFASPSSSGSTSSTTTSLYNSNSGSSPIGQVTSTEPQEGVYSIQDGLPNQTSTLNNTTIDPTQVTPNANGSFTFGSPQPDANGLVNQMTVNGTFGLAGLTVTNPTTGAAATVALDNAARRCRKAATPRPARRTSRPRRSRATARSARYIRGTIGSRARWRPFGRLTDARRTLRKQTRGTR